MEQTRTKYPIILVHGIALKDMRFFKSFGHIADVLRESGYTVYTANTDGFGSIENNAAQLKAQIQDILKTEDIDKINIIGHSKGGLDSIYMIRELDMADSVASLTTLCTPHRGSSMASKIYGLPRWITKFIAFWINFWYRIFGDKNPDALTVCRQLRLSSDDDLPVPEGVYCQSYSATMEKSRDDFLLTIPLLFSRHWGEAVSDGLVTPESAKYAEYRGDCIEESLSHGELVGLTLKKKKLRKVYAFYLNMCRDLSERGF